MRKIYSSLGKPIDIEAAEIVIGDPNKDGNCELIYNGTGEVSDHVMDITGKTAAITFDHSGTGLLKLSSELLISGYGASKNECPHRRYIENQ